MFRLDGKIALVTGGSRGLGRAISVALGSAGAHVIVNYRAGEAAARQTAEAIRAAGGHAEISHFDVGDAAAIDAAIGALIKTHGAIDIAVNNAGVARDQLLMRVNQGEFDESMAVNLGGALWVSKSVIRAMMRKKSGRIINLASVIGESGNVGQAVYSATKAGLIGMTKSLAREYASRGITVNAIAPGYIETDMTAELPEAARQAVIQSTPLGRVGRPEEVASAALYLASEEAGYVTGQVLRVNGGMYM